MKPIKYRVISKKEALDLLIKRVDELEEWALEVEKKLDEKMKADTKLPSNEEYNKRAAKALEPF